MTHKRKRPNPSRETSGHIAKRNAAQCSSGKAGYEHRAAARSAAAYATKSHGTPLSIYKCPECKLWHKTKQPGRTSNGTVIT